MSKALCIALEGADRLGKGTQSKLLVGWLKSRGYRVRLFDVLPTDRIVQPLIDHALLVGTAKSWPNFFQMVKFVNRFLFQMLMMPFYRRLYDVLVFDRWRMSGLVYGDVTGVKPALNAWMHDRLFEPDVTIILDGVPHHSMKVNDSYESDEAFQEHVRSLYHNVGWDPKVHVVPSREGRLAVHDAVCAVVLDHLRYA